MSKLSSVALTVLTAVTAFVAIAVLGSSAAMAEGLTREQVRAELLRARANGELGTVNLAQYGLPPSTVQAAQASERAAKAGVSAGK